MGGYLPISLEKLKIETLPGPPRFIMLNPCVTVSGNVSVVRFPADGDAVMALTLDKPYSKWLR